MTEVTGASEQRLRMLNVRGIIAITRMVARKTHSVNSRVPRSSRQNLEINLHMAPTFHLKARSKLFPRQIRPRMESVWLHKLCH